MPLQPKASAMAAAALLAQAAVGPALADEPPAEGAPVLAKDRVIAALRLKIDPSPFPSD